MKRFSLSCMALVLAAGCEDGGLRGDAMVGEASVGVARDHAARAPAPGENDRIHEHLATVERELRSRDVGHLTSAEQAARRRVLDWLSQYREARRYPHNHVRPTRTPVFVDPHGTPCAVAYLMLRSGAGALVEDVARTANLALVPELAGDPRLAPWFDANGLTLEEAAAIQPAYGGRSTNTRSGDGYSTWTTAFGMATAVVSLYNIRTRDDEDPGPSVSTLAGLGLGFAHIGLTLHALMNDRPDPGWALAVNLVGTALSAVTTVGKARSSEPVADDATAVEPFVAGGPAGLRLGLTVRH